MEKNNKDLIKNIGISILVIIALILLIMVVSYNKIAIGKVIPKVEEYQLDNEIKNELESDETDENSEIITTIIVHHQRAFTMMMELNNFRL